MEVWKEISGFCGYQVSNIGRVKRSKKDKEKIIRQQKTNSGYLSVSIYKCGKQYRKNVHRLVADAFLRNENELPFVNHKDENKLNNSVENLEWCSADYNMNYGTINKRISDKRKERTSVKKKPVVQFIGDGKNGIIFESISSAAKETGTQRTSILNCCKGTQKTANGYKWKYAN